MPPDSEILTIRPASFDDCGAIARLAEQLGYPITADEVRVSLVRLFSSNDDEVYVAEIGEQIVGWLHVATRRFVESGAFAEIVGLVVEEQIRSQGVGRKLVAEAEAWAAQMGHVRIRVRSNVAREQAKHFYERLGYVATKQQNVFDKRVIPSSE